MNFNVQSIILSFVELVLVVGAGRRPGLGVVLLLLEQCAHQFSLVLESHKQHAQKLASLSELRAEDLRQVRQFFCLFVCRYLPSGQVLLFNFLLVKLCVTILSD